GGRTRPFEPLRPNLDSDDVATVHARRAQPRARRTGARPPPQEARPQGRRPRRHPPDERAPDRHHPRRRAQSLPRPLEPARPLPASLARRAPRRRRALRVLGTRGLLPPHRGLPPLPPPHARPV